MQRITARDEKGCVYIKPRVLAAYPDKTAYEYRRDEIENKLAMYEEAEERGEIEATRKSGICEMDCIYHYRHPHEYTSHEQVIVLRRSDINPELAPIKICIDSNTVKNAYALALKISDVIAQHNQKNDTEYTFIIVSGELGD